MVEEGKHKNKKYRIEILGEELVVSGDISENYVQELSGYINEVGDEILNAYPHLPRRYLLGLTIVNITDEFYKLRKKYFNNQQDKKRLLSDRKRLEDKIKALRQDNEELSTLLEEVDG